MHHMQTALYLQNDKYHLTNESINKLITYKS